MEGHKITRQAVYCVVNDGAKRKLGLKHRKKYFATVCLREITVLGENGALKHYYAKGVAILGKGDKYTSEGKLYAQQRAEDAANLFADVGYSPSGFLEVMQNGAKKPIYLRLLQILTIDQLSNYEMNKLGLWLHDLPNTYDKPQGLEKTLGV